MKRCPHCGEEKPLGAFARDRSKSGGRKSWCSACEYAKKRGKPHRMQANRRAVRAWNDAHPEALRAQRLLWRAIRRGEVVRPATCSFPGCVGKPDAHHPDYSRPLDVLWFCRGHHRVWHESVALEARA